MTKAKLFDMAGDVVANNSSPIATTFRLEKIFSIIYDTSLEAQQRLLLTFDAEQNQVVPSDRNVARKQNVTDLTNTASMVLIMRC